MALLLEQFQQNFKGHPVPELLKELLFFQNRVNDWYSGSFELAIAPYHIFDTYIIENDVLNQFISFGHDGNGSDYALWLYKEEMLPENAPIMYINSEGEGSTVLANTLQEFLLILAYDEEPIFGEYSETEDQIVHTPANYEFKIWVRTMYNLNINVIPNDIYGKHVYNILIYKIGLMSWFQNLEQLNKMQ